MTNYVPICYQEKNEITIMQIGCLIAALIKVYLEPIPEAIQAPSHVPP